MPSIQRPLDTYFNPSEYTKPFKLSAKCYIKEAVELLERNLIKREMDWFLNHAQFRHIFHMAPLANHKLMGMWVLLLRTAKLEKKKECWFIVNGVPVRYSLREMALMSGLNCKKYPPEKRVVRRSEDDVRFAAKHFPLGSTISLKEVEKKLLSMDKPSGDDDNERLKMAVLYFLSSIIIGKRKGGEQAPSVDKLFIDAVDDLEMCKTYPWGRLAFDENMKDIFHCLDNFKGVVKSQWIFPSFVIPLEVNFSNYIFLYNLYNLNILLTMYFCITCILCSFLLLRQFLL